MIITLTYKELVALDPCSDRLNEATRRIGGPRKWGDRKVSAADAVQAGITLGDLLWVVGAMARTNPDAERRLRLWMADCAARVLPIFEKAHPDDSRPRNAISTARAFARGETTAAAWAAARAAAWDAAWDAAGAAARDAARAAVRAAARAAAWAAARDAAWDAAGAAAGAAAWDAEEEWQLTRLVAWLSDDEPDDWPITEAERKAA